ncbi:isoaspartyl peptidase/L-asparaginase [Anabrus simplex]|uniref:isoaspartyl peptidase/L-asparaginase n=1 Tax=Anabrus simplex TaxID=316456 RepID=UPI0035A2A3B4
MIEPVVLVHGGAGDIPDERIQPKLDGVRRAAKAGYKALMAPGGNVLDAVVAAVHIMEDDGAFNAGHGSVLNTDGEVEMDAIIMEGKNLHTGAVGALKDVQHAIDVARLVMEKTPHCLLVADGAKRFANEMGVPDYPQENLITSFAKDALSRHVKGNTTVSEIGWTGGTGTVGAVAIDENGHLAVAVSTGGTTGKMPGRVGDTALCGCGGYSDDRVGAVSTTGHGESIIKLNLARDILARMEQGRQAQCATAEGCDNLKEILGFTAGAITLSNRGDVGVGFSSKRMSWAYKKGHEVHYGIDPGQHMIDHDPKCS